MERAMAQSYQEGRVARKGESVMHPTAAYTKGVKELRPDWKDFLALVLALYSLLLPPLLAIFGALFLFLLLVRVLL
ncbi:hypothetical protein YIM1627_00570 [Thermus oshimai]